MVNRIDYGSTCLGKKGRFVKKTACGSRNSIKKKGYGYTVYSRPKGADYWRAERTFGVKSFADEWKEAFIKRGKEAKIKKNF